MNNWDHALDHFEASVAAMSTAIESGDWVDVVVAPLPIDELTGPTPEQQARLRCLDEQWRHLEPLLLDALAALDEEITVLAGSRRGRTEYARYGA